MNGLDVFFSGTAQNIIVAILTWIIVVTFKWLISFYKEKKPLKKIYRIGNNKNISIIIPTIVNKELGKKEHVEYSTTIEPIRILRNIIENIDKINKNIRIKYLFSEESNKESLQDNLILIGGPINNKVTKKFYEKIRSLPFSFEGHDLKVKNKDNIETIYRAKKNVFEGREVVEEDYVAVIICKSPWNNQSNIIHFAGCWAYGSIGAVKFLNEENILNDNRLNCLNVNDDILIVLRMDIEHFGKDKESDIINIKLIHLEKFNA